jgi:hypothetical protein
MFVAFRHHGGSSALLEMAGHFPDGHPGIVNLALI